MNLHPDHLENLRRSGLSDETILEAGIESVPPDEIGKICLESVGYVPAGITSMYRIPYPRVNGFCRHKPLYKEGKGEPKYLQKRNSGNRLYIPEKARAVLNDPAVPLYFTEGEKKALKACQEGLACIGLSGLWNWKNKGSKELILDFDLIIFTNRTVYIVPDNDWLEPNRHGYKKNLEEAVKELAYRLIKRGARVFIVQLPKGINNENGIG
ncbi:MAG: DUF3854 domain-containing protein [Pseudomonadota bacterium]